MTLFGIGGRVGVPRKTHGIEINLTVSRMASDGNNDDDRFEMYRVWHRMINVLRTLGILMLPKHHQKFAQ